MDYRIPVSTAMETNPGKILLIKQGSPQMEFESNYEIIYLGSV